MTSISRTTSSSPTSSVSQSLISRIERFFKSVGISANLPENSIHDDAYTDLIRGLLKVDHIEHGRVTCTLIVKPPVSNKYGSLHGGAVASVAQMVAVACVRSVVDKDLFLGELATSYVSAALVNAELEVVGSIVRQGRNVTVTSVEFRSKDSNKVVYIARATFYNLPVASL